MTAKSPFTETIIANALVAILERLESMEHTISALAPRQTPQNVKQALLRERLGNLTLKRHAVLTATLGGQSYKAIAKFMECDLTTVKLHLKAALNGVGVKGRADLLANESNLLQAIPDAEYAQRYGISKQWWMEDNPELLKVLQTTKAPRNQHTKPTENGSAP